MNKTFSSYLLAAVCAGAVVLPLVDSASAQTSVNVPDFSFEAPTTTSFQDNAGLAAGSAIPNTGNAWYYLGGFTGSGSPAGVENTAANSASTGGLGTQNGYLNVGASMGSGVLLTIAANTTYTLTVAEARRGGGFAQTAGFTIGLGYGTAAGVTPTSAASLSVGLPATTGVFNDYTVSFTTGATGAAIGQNLFVVLGSAAAAGNNPVDFDNVRVTFANVPEPSSVALAAGAAGLLWLLRRRRQTA